jgi:Zn-finger nucleic acid-binding protein
MVIDRRFHEFDQCPMCRGMAIILPVDEDHGDIERVRAANNEAQVKELRLWLKNRGLI